MYFEARTHESLAVSGPAEAVRLFHSRKVHSQQCPCWKNSKDQRLALVDDSHIDATFYEVALVNLDTREQIESLTFGRHTEAEKLQLVMESLAGDFVFRTNVNCPMDGGAQDSAHSDITSSTA